MAEFSCVWDISVNDLKAEIFTSIRGFIFFMKLP